MMMMIIWFLSRRAEVIVNYSIVMVAQRSRGVVDSRKSKQKGSWSVHIGLMVMAETTSVHLCLDALCRVFGYLSLTDRLNCSLVCQRWKEAVGQSLGDVHIDPSTPYNGSWMEHNRFAHKIYAEHWCGDQKLKVTKDTADIVDKIIHCTPKIKSLHVECMFLNANVLSRLLLSQDGIQELVVEIHPTELGYNSTFEEELIGGIIKHKYTLQRLDLKITIDPSICTSSSSDMARYLLHCQDVSFPMLTSLKFSLLGPTIGSLILLLRKLVSEAQLEELMINVPDIEHAEINQIISHCFKNHNLEKIQIDCINEFGGVCMYFPKYVDLLLENCQNLTHLNFLDIDDKRGNYQQITPAYEKPLTRMLENYGDSLQHLQCYISREISETIIRCCANLKTLCIECNMMTDEELLQFAKLDNLERVALKLINKQPLVENSSVTGWAVAGFLASCGRNLNTLMVDFYGKDAAKIPQATGENCPNVTKLWLKIRDIERHGSIVEAGVVALEKCSNLKYLHLDLMAVRYYDSSRVRNGTPLFKIIKTLQGKTETLEWLSFGAISNIMPKRILRWFTENWPHCRIERETQHLFLDW